MGAFRAVTSVLTVVLFINAALHTVLMMSDGEQYRNWVAIQIVLQLLGVGLLYLIRQYKFWVLAIFSALSVPGI